MNKRILFLLAITLTGVSQLSNAGLLKDQIFNIDEHQRTYDLYLPSQASKELSPLVLLLHGHIGNADVMTGANGKPAPYKIWLDIADREGWLLLIPDGEFGVDENRGWNDCRADATTNPTTDDVKFLNSLVDELADQYPIDKGRIYAHGTSNGGNMAFRLALESGRKFRAIAAVVASMPDKSKCTELNQPVSVLVMNGVDDPITPYDGGVVAQNSSKHDRGTVLSTSATIDYWLKNNEIETQPITQQLPNISRLDRSTVRKVEYFGGAEDTEVVLYEIDGGGHTSPSLSEHYGLIYRLIVGRQNKDIEMSEEVWKFFDRNQ